MNSPVVLQSPAQFKTRASRYERYASFLVASIIVVGLLVSILLLLWLTSLEWTPNKEAEHFEMPPVGDTIPDGVADSFEEPGVEELADVPEPQLAKSIEAMTNDPSSVQALESINGNKSKQGKGRGPGNIRGTGTTAGTGGVPDGARWNIRYTTATKKAYYQQLDYFGIELGAVDMKASYIGYASELSKEKPTSRSGNRKEEGRIYFSFREGFKLKRWDVEKLTAAGIVCRGRLVVQFYPPKTRQILFDLEKKKLRDGEDVRNVKKTNFGVRATPEGFEYYVDGDIQYK